MIRVNLFDQNFAHVKNSTGYDASCFIKPSCGEWVRNQMIWDGNTIFSDEMCFSDAVDQVKSTHKIAWLMESPGVKPFIYKNFNLVQDKFDSVLTFLSFDIASSIGIEKQKYINCPLGGSWVQPQEIQVEKNKLCSLIASEKNDLPGHRLRHEIAKCSKNIDLYGRAYKRIDNKSEALDRYAFSIVIENLAIPGYFTEKLIDCMLMRTVPLYYGDPEIGKLFDIDGILTLNDIDSLNFSRYKSMIKSIDNNFKIALDFKSSDDIVFKKLKSLT